MSKTKSEKRMGLWHMENGAYVKQEGTGMYDGEWLDETTTNTHGSWAQDPALQKRLSPANTLTAACLIP
jgi:hypothetical protein